GICAWDNKCAFASVRPITAIRYLFQGKQVRAWGGPGQGAQTIRGEDWFPYQTRSFPTPPFPEYSSGHSNFSAAGAEILRLCTGGARLGSALPGDEADRRRNLVSLPADDLPDAAPPRILVRTQQLHRRRSRDTQAVHGQ